MDKSGANKAAIDEMPADREVPTGIRQVKYLNIIVETDHRAVKRATLNQCSVLKPFTQPEAF